MCVWGILMFLLCWVLLTHTLLSYHFRTQKPSLRYDRKWNILIGHKQEQYSTPDEIPQSLVNMVVAIEDRRFWFHPGIDPISLLRAIIANVRHESKRQWASTIDQQLIKLDTKQFTRWRRAKINENRRALNLQFHHSKKDILLRYINTVPFSHAIVWRKSACRSYWGKACEHLTSGELLITLAIAQLGANPYTDDGWDRIMQKANIYVKAKPELFISSREIPDSLKDWLQSFPAPLDPRVSSWLRNTTPSGSTSYDLTLSKNIDTILYHTSLQREQYKIRDCCIVILNEKWEMLSMNICSDRNDPEAGKINSCLVPRQTWSAIKAFLYLFAFKKLWLDPNDAIVDEPVQFDLGGWNIYDPKNFDLTYHGAISYAYALGNSLNVPAIKTLYAVGVEPFLQFLKHQLRVTSPWSPINPKTASDVWLSLALGTYELSPRQFTQLWRILLPNYAPIGYEWERQAIVGILSDPTNKLVSFGQDNFLSPPGWAIKTGTSRNFVDGRICGVQVSQKITACIRLGNYNNDSMLGASSEVWSYIRSLITQAIHNTTL